MRTNEANTPAKSSKLDRALLAIEVAGVLIDLLQLLVDLYPILANQ